MPEDNKTIKMHSGPENFDKFQNLFNKGFYYQYSRNMLQQNNGDGTFSEVVNWLEFQTLTGVGLLYSAITITTVIRTCL